MEAVKKLPVSPVQEKFDDGSPTVLPVSSQVFGFAGRNVLPVIPVQATSSSIIPSVQLLGTAGMNVLPVILLKSTTHATLLCQGLESQPSQWLM